MYVSGRTIALYIHDTYMVQTCQTRWHVCTRLCQVVRNPDECNWSWPGSLGPATQWLAAATVTVQLEVTNAAARSALPGGAGIWNPVLLDRIGQNGTYWYVPVRTGTTRYRSVREFHGCTYRYVPAHTGTYFQQDRLFSDPPRLSQER
jgi:hypothetical protein